MAFILIGIVINQTCSDLDFEIELADDVMEKIEQKYKKALQESGMDEDDFGPTYYEQLKKEDKELADKIEDAVWDTFYNLIKYEYDGEDDRVEAMLREYVQDEEGNWYQDYTIDNKFEIDLTDFPRLA